MQECLFETKPLGMLLLLSIATCDYSHGLAHADFLSQLAQNKQTFTLQPAARVRPSGSAPKMTGTPSYNTLAQPQWQDALALSSNLIN